MTRLHNTAQAGSAQAHTAYCRHSLASADREIREAEKRVREQEAHVLRLIVQGAPTQSAEDLLRELISAAKALKRRHALASG